MKRPLYLICLSFAFIIAVLVRNTPPPGYESSFYNGEVVTVTGKVDRIEKKDDKWIISLTSISYAGKSSCHIPFSKIQQNENTGTPKDAHSTPMGVLCYLSGTYVPRMGSLVIVSGNFRAFDEAANEGQFNAREYYQIQGMDFSLRNGEIKGESREYSGILQGLFMLRRKWSAVYDRLLPAREATTMQAMVLGEKAGLDPNIKSIYMRNGIAHILAISGMHISFIGMGIYSILRKLRIPAILSSVMGFLCMLGYGVMTDAGTSSLRAVLMFTLFLGARIAGRTYDLRTALALAGMILLAGQPLSIKSTSFLLSFGAVFGMALAAPVFQSIFPKKSKATNGISATLGVSYFSLPIMTNFFYEYPIYSPLLNLLVIPFSGLLLLCGIIGGLLGMVWDIPARVVLQVCRGVLWLYENLCSGMEELPYHIQILGKSEEWQILFFYGLLLALSFLGDKAKKKIRVTITKRQGENTKKGEKYTRMLYGVGVCLLLLAGIGILLLRLPENTRITMLDIGQGDCIVVQTKGGDTLLMDAGSSSIKDCDKYRLIPYLKSEGVQSISYAFLSHPDSDHYSMLLALMEKKDEYHVGIECLVLSESARGNPAYESLLEAARQSGCQIAWIGAGGRIRTDDVSITCLWDGTEYVGNKDNNETSMVLWMECGSIHTLFTGDLGMEGEKNLVGRLPGPCTILKAAHHGSRNSSSREFLQAVSPEITLISCGKENSYGHPHRETLQRLSEAGSKVYITKDSGMITIKIKEDGLILREYCKTRTD